MTKLKKIIELKKALTLIIFLSLGIISNAQFAISKNNKFTDRIITMYEKKHFTGVRLCRINRHDFLICAIEVPKNLSSDLDRFAFVKAQSAVNEFLNGSNVSSSTTTVLEEKSSSVSNSTNDSMNTSANKQYILNMIDKINTNSSGFVNGIGSIYNAEIESHQKKVYLYVKEIF
jgi:hypothetical protein